MNHQRTKKAPSAVGYPTHDYLGAIFEKSNVGIAIGDTGGKILAANPAFQKMLGYSGDELTFLLFNDLTHPDDIEENEKLNDELYRGKIESYQLEKRYFRKDGGLLWVRLTVTLVHDVLSQPDITIGILEDISKRKATEEALASRDSILEAVSYSAERFLIAAHWEDVIDSVLNRLGRAANISRVYLFKDKPAENGVILSSQKYEWVSAGVTPQIDNPKLRNIPLCQHFPQWGKKLHQRHVVVDHIRNLPPEQQALLVAQDIKSIVLVPIFVSDTSWGHIGFDECGKEREWSLAEIEALKAAVNILGAAIERNRIEFALQEHNQRLEALSRKLVNVQEKERRALSLELHDEIGQVLTAIKLALHFSQQQTDLGDKNRELIRINSLVDDLMQRIKDISHSIRPPMLDDLGLLPTILWHIENYTGQTQIEIIFKHTGVSGKRFNAEVETSIYRIFQEALTNVARHAQVNQVNVWLWASSFLIGITIEDNGAGFNLEKMFAAGYRSNGLTGMRERASLLDGRFTVESAPGRGTRVLVEIPLEKTNPMKKESGHD